VLAFQIISITAVIAALVWFTWQVLFRAEMVTYLRMRKLPRRTIATLVPGERVWLVGTARAGTLTTSIFSHKPCIMSTLRDIAKYGDSDAMVVGEDFELEDAGARVQICGRGEYEADLFEEFAGTVDDAAANATFGKDILERERTEIKTSRTDVVTQHEGMLLDGMRVAVGGTVERGDDGTLRLVGARDLPLYVIDVRRHYKLRHEAA
jgi:hypothetical protein